MKLQRKALRYAIAIALGTLPGVLVQVAVAQDPEQPSSASANPTPTAMPELSTTDLLNLLVSEGVLTKEAAIRLVNTLRMRAERAQTTEKEDEPPVSTRTTVVVPYIPPHVEERIAESIKEDLAAEVVENAKREGISAPEWVSRVQLSGDVRVRYSGEFYPSDNPRGIRSVFDLNEINDTGSTDGAGRHAFVDIYDDRHRLLGRTRLRLTAQPADDVEIGVRLTSGSNGNPVSANQTLGRYGAKWEANFDLAYIQYQTDRVNLAGGRIENPWLSTDLVWDRDMTFEGLFAQISPFRLGNERSFWHTYINLGAFPIQEIHQYEFEGELDTPDDKWLYNMGLRSQLQFSANHQLDQALTYHEYKNVTGIRNAPGEDSQNVSAPRFWQWGNLYKNISVPLPGGGQEELYGLAGEFELINFTTRYQYLGFDKYKLSFSADYVQNLAWDLEQTFLAAGALPEDIPMLKDRDIGYQIEMGFGTKERKSRGDWGVSLTYRYLEGDAALDAFADSDFLTGGTGAQGYIIKGQQFMADNVWLELTLISADDIDYHISVDEGDVREDAIMLDLNARF